MEESASPTPVARGAGKATHRWSIRFAMVVLVVVILVTSVGGYAGLQWSRAAPVSRLSCAPSVGCGGSENPNDVTLFVPYSVDAGQPYSQVAAGASVLATVGVLDGESIASYSVTWAPGQTVSNSTGLLSYAYSTPGLYTVFATATTADGVVHTGTTHLVPLKVNPSAATVRAGILPIVSLSLTNSSGGRFPWIGAGGSVTVNGSYTAPSAVGVQVLTPLELTIPPGSVQSAVSVGMNYASAKYTFPTPGYFPVTLRVAGADSSGTIYQNYTWGILVGNTTTGLGCSECSMPEATSPHPSTLVYYSLAAGGAITLDPAADYYSVGYEVGQSIDESLIYFNGTDSGPTPTNFVAGAATCVPGSAQCASLYDGNTLVRGDNYTFALDPAAHFYDPYTGVSREVYPVDVMYTIIRAIFYTQVDTVTGYYAGYDIAGPLIPYAGLESTEVNASWDFGPDGEPLHYPYNNTPKWTLDAFAVNDSAFCPSAALAANGCITFHADADGKSWPALLQILTMISIDGIQASGWYAAQGARVPGFDCPPDADSPCLLPGGATSTNSTAPAPSG